MCEARNNGAVVIEERLGQSMTLGRVKNSPASRKIVLQLQVSNDA